MATSSSVDLPNASNESGKAQRDEESGRVQLKKGKRDTSNISNHLKFLGFIGVVVLISFVLFIVVISMSASGKGSINTEHHEKFCERIKKYAMTKTLAGTGFNHTPEVYDMNRCRRTLSCSFNVLSCTTLCPLGYETEDDCVISCECAKHGIMQLDIQFDEDTVPALIQQMSDDPSADFVVFSPESGIMPWKQDVIGGRPQIPYVLSEDLSSSQKTSVMVAFGTLRDLTCIDFVPRYLELDYINIQNGNGDCSASYSRHQGKNDLNIESCYSSSHVLHVLMHSLGFHHEHMREDRDAYINILWDNVDPAFENAFSKLNPSNYVVSNFDIKSIMMLDGFAFSKTDEKTDPTMINLDTNKTVIGGGLTLTAHDIEDIEATYCRATTVMDSLPVIEETAAEERSVKNIHKELKTIKIDNIENLSPASRSGDKKSEEEAVTIDVNDGEGSSPVSRADDKDVKKGKKTIDIDNIEEDLKSDLISDNELKTIIEFDESAADITETDKDLVPSMRSLGATETDRDLTPAVRNSGIGWGEEITLTDTEMLYSDGTRLWSQWSRCHKTCGGDSVQTRVQECLLPYCESDPKKETKTCKTDPCPKKVVWGEWQEWESCSKTCGSGIRYRYKECLEDCEGEVKPTEVEKCNTDNCISDKPEFLPWSTWYECAATCGPSKRIRTRDCRDPQGKHSFECIGETHKKSSFEMGFEACNMGECVNKIHYPIDTGVVVPPKKELLEFKEVFERKSKNISKEHCDTLPNFYWFLGDFNGDGITDTMCGEDVNMLKIFLLSSHETYAYAWSGRLNCAIDFIFIGDFNGDGFSDIFCKSSLLSTNLVYRSIKPKGFKAALNVGSFCLNVRDKIQILDVNGDKKSDIICRHDDNKDDTDIYLSTLSS